MKLELTLGLHLHRIVYFATGGYFDQPDGAHFVFRGVGCRGGCEPVSDQFGQLCGPTLQFYSLTPVGEPEPLRTRSRFARSETDQSGFAWGYGGGGPHELAEAILTDYCGPDLDVSRGTIHRFVAQVIQKLPQKEGWVLTWEDIDKFLKEQG